MATRIWTNAIGDNQWTTAGNWTGSAVPTGADDVVLDETSSANINAASGLTAPQSIRVTAGYRGQAGGASGLIFGGTLGSLVYAAGGGFLRIGCSAGGITKAEAYSVGGTLFIVGSATLAELISSRGRHFVDSTTPLTDLKVYNDSIVEVSANGTGITSIITGGTVIVNSRNITTVNVASTGHVLLRGTTAMTTGNVYGTLTQEGSGTLTTTHLFPGGSVLLTHNSKPFTGSTINVHAGYRRFDRYLPSTGQQPWTNVIVIGHHGGTAGLAPGV